MRIIARSTLKSYCASLVGTAEYVAVQGAIAAWIAEVGRAHWSSMADVKQLYRHASVIDAERVVFNIRGNAHRLVTAIDFRREIVFIKWIGNHRDYDRIDVREVQYEN
jgi:mRNA interferase HigB